MTSAPIPDQLIVRTRGGDEAALGTLVESRSRCFWSARTQRSTKRSPHSASPSYGAVQREPAVLLADAMDRLPPDYREVFVLLFRMCLS